MYILNFPIFLKVAVSVDFNEIVVNSIDTTSTQEAGVLSPKQFRFYQNRQGAH